MELREKEEEEAGTGGRLADDDERRGCIYGCGKDGGAPEKVQLLGGSWDLEQPDIMANARG